MISFDEFMMHKPSIKDLYIKHNREFNSKEATFENLYDCICSDVEIVLNCLKVSPKRYGYMYWKIAVFMCIVSEKNNVSICNDIYPAIAKSYNKSEGAVEHAMRLCLETTLYDTNKISDNYICDYIRKFLLNPRNSEFLVKIVDLIVSDEFQKVKGKYMV